MDNRITVKIRSEIAMRNLDELNRLPAEKARAEEGGGDQPEASRAPLVLLDGVQRKHHGERGHEEDERQDAGERNVQDVRRREVRSHQLRRVHLRLEHEEHGDERAEEDAFGAEEGPHPELPDIK